MGTQLQRQENSPVAGSVVLVMSTQKLASIANVKGVEILTMLMGIKRLVFFRE